VTARASRSSGAPSSIQRFVKQLLVTCKAVKLYPLSSNIPLENAQAAAVMLHGILERGPDVSFGVTKDALVFEGVPVYPGQPTYTAFAREFFSRNLAEFRFHSGVTPQEIARFLGVLRYAPDEIAAAGGFETMLWDLQVDCVTVKDLSARLVDTEIPQAGEGATRSGEPWPPDAERIDHALSVAYVRRPRDQRLLVRVIEEPAVVAAFLREFLTGRGERPDEGVAERVAALAHVTAREVPSDQPSLLRSLADAVLDLPPDALRGVLRDAVLPDARNDEALADLVRQIGVDAALQAIVTCGVAEDAESEAMCRAIRTLALVSEVERSDVVARTQASLEDAGCDPGFVAHVLEGVAPTRLKVRERLRPDEERPEDTVLRLLDLAPAAVGPDDPGDPETEALREEARVGITDGDILGAFVTLATIETRPDAFSTVMSTIEDNLGLLLERADLDVAADAAEALAAAASDPAFDERRRTRVENALVKLAQPKAVRTIADAMRVFRPGSDEYAACHRLLDVLGRHAISPLLEVLADEEDRAARKTIVDLVASMADGFVDDLGERVADPRWYFVRNVIGILAKTRSAKALPHLGRTLRHADARVRRETIRALAGIDDRLADQMLVAALADEDAQNVQLAARYLGKGTVRGATAALAEVAKGEGRGSRDGGPRIEAIGALGSIGDPAAVPALEAILHARALRGAAKARELRAAAEAALAALRGRGGAPL